MQTIQQQRAKYALDKVKEAARTTNKKEYIKLCISPTRNDPHEWLRASSCFL